MILFKTDAWISSLDYLFSTMTGGEKRDKRGKISDIHMFEKFNFCSIDVSILKTQNNSSVRKPV